MSDLHGNYLGYKAMLQKIKFCYSDTLYVLGDVIDRGEGSIKILQDMMVRSNVIPIIGNHEYMALNCLKALSHEITLDFLANLNADTIDGYAYWLSVGGDKTCKEFCKLSNEERENVIDYLSNFSLYETLTTTKGEFILVHAGLDNFYPSREIDNYDISEMIFNPPDYQKVYFKDKYLVTGHTPTRGIFENESKCKANDKYRDEILIKNNHIAIDCGSGYGGRVGCINLDTLDCYYV